MRKYLSIVFLFVASLVIAQNPQFPFKKEYNGETVLIEDINKETYMAKLKKVNRIKNGSVGNWDKSMFDSLKVNYEGDSCFVLEYGNGKTKKFCSWQKNGSYRKYRLTGFIKKLNSILVVEENYNIETFEGGTEVITISVKNGEQSNIIKHPAISPKGDKFVIGMYNMVSFEVGNGIMLGRIEQGRFYMDIEINGEKDGYWGAVDPVWISNTEVVFLRMWRDKKTTEEIVKYCRMIVK